MIQMTEEEFEAIAKKIFATGVRIGYQKGGDDMLAYVHGRGSCGFSAEVVWDDDVQWMREVTYETPMDITKIEDWDKV
jgi:hypothetical protein